MNNQTAIGLLLGVFALLLADYLLFDFEYSTLTARRLLNLISWLAFWR